MDANSPQWTPGMEQHHTSKNSNQLPVCPDWLTQEKSRWSKAMSRKEFQLGGVAAAAAACVAYKCSSSLRDCGGYFLHNVSFSNQIGLPSLPDNWVATHWHQLHTSALLSRFALPSTSSSFLFFALLQFLVFFFLPFPFGFIVYFTVQLRWQEGRKEGSKLDQNVAERV